MRCFVHTRCIGILALALGSALCPAAESQPIRVLMIANGEYHDYKTLPPLLATHLSADGSVKVDIVDDVRKLDPARLQQIDVLLFNTCDQTDVPPPVREAILDFVGEGKGLVSMHCSLWSYQKWPEWAALLGGFAPGHDKFRQYEVNVLDPAHPVMKGLGRSFEITDEPYYVDKRDPADDVLGRTHDILQGPDGKKREGPEPHVWTKTYKKGRVFVTTFGHDAKSQDDEHFLSLLRNGILWAAHKLPETPHNVLSDEEKQAGFKLLFNGKDLEGWLPDPAHWSVEDGVIVGRTKGKGDLKHNQFLILKDQYGDFVLKFSIKLRNHNSGVQIRSKALPEFVVTGYQPDAADKWFGSLYEEKGRGVLVEGWKNKGEKIATVDGWNDFVVRAEGPRITITLNGVKTAEYEERDANQPTKGVIALQIHAGPAMEVRFRDMKIQPLGEKP